MLKEPLTDEMKQLALLLWDRVKMKWILTTDLVLIENCIMTLETINMINEIRPIVYIQHSSGYVVLITKVQGEYNKNIGMRSDYTDLLTESVLDKDFTIIRSNLVPDELVDDFKKLKMAEV